MRFTTVVVAAFFAIAVSFGNAAAGEQQLAHAIFVKVNGQTITQEQVVEVVKFIVKRDFNNVMPEDEEMLDRIQRAALRDLVRALLIRDEASQLGVRGSRDLDRYIERGFGLKPEEITIAIRRLLEADELFSDVMMASGTPIRDPSPKELKDFYTKNREEFRTSTFIIVRTIFIQIDPRRSQAYTKRQGEELMDKLAAVPLSRRTEEFANTAKESSSDIFAQFGGLLTGNSPEPWIPIDFENENPDGSPIFPPTMVEEIRRLKRSGDLRLAVSQDGVHLLYCEDVRGGKDMRWDEAKRIIEFVLKERSKNSRMRGWLNQVYDRSDVRWHDGTVYEKNELTEVLLPSEQGPGET